MSVLHTLKKQQVDVVAHLKAVLDLFAVDIYKILPLPVPRSSHLKLKDYFLPHFQLDRYT